MTYEIHFEHQDGTPDSLIISGATIKDIQEQAKAEIKKRNGKNPWAKEIQ